MRTNNRSVARILPMLLAWLAAPALAAEKMQTVQTPESRPAPAKPAQGTKRVARHGGESTATRPAPAANRRAVRGKRAKAKIDSLDADLRHDGCYWAIEIEYEIETKGYDAAETFALEIEVMEDGKPILDDGGQPIATVIDLVEPTKDKKNKREYEGRVRARVHKDWVGDDDDLEVKASLIRTSDGRILDVEDESADQDRPGPVLHIGAFGVGISITL